MFYSIFRKRKLLSAFNNELFLLVLSILLYLFMFFSIFSNLAYADIEHGKQVFHKKCALCHFADKQQNKIGPSLYKIIGRKAASLANYPYSAAMRQKGKEGLVWNRQSMQQYLANPHKMVPGTKMAIMFFRNQNDFKDLMEYLDSVK